MNARLVACSALVLAAACHPAKPPATPGTAAAPAPQGMGDAQVKALLAREQPPMPRHEVVLDDGTVKASVESAAAPTLARQDKEVLLTIPIGTGQPVFCHIAPQVDPASSLQRVFKAVERFPRREITSSDAGELAGSPFLALTVLYIVEPQRLLGQVTMFALRRDSGVGLICTHDEPGYQATVRRVVASVAETLTTSDPPAPKSLCREVAIMSNGGRKFGFDTTRITRTADGQLVELETSSALHIRTPTEFEGADAYDVTHSRNGIVLEELHVLGNGGSDELEAHLTLKLEKGSQYHVSGKFKGKAIDLRFDAPALHSFERRAELVRSKILGSRGAELSLNTWAPGTNPGGVEKYLIRSLADGTYQATDEAGILSTVELDAGGLPTRMTAKIASQELTMERLSMDGRCP